MSNDSAPLNGVAPAFVEMAHRIVWCVAATVDPTGRPRTRVLHPLWEWDGTDLVGWIATSPLSPKARHLAHQPLMSLTYWAANHDTCSAECAVEWIDDPDGKRAGWEKFATAPPPVGYDPSIIPPWTSPEAPAFGVIKLTPTRLHVMPGSVLAGAGGTPLTWRHT